jgi:hypothetical protein
LALDDKGGVATPGNPDKGPAADHGACLLNGLKVACGRVRMRCSAKHGRKGWLGQEGFGVLQAVFDGFNLDRDSVHYIDDRLDLEFENRKDARDIVNVRWIVSLNDHVTTVVTYPDHELVHSKTVGHFPIFVEYL